MKLTKKQINEIEKANGKINIAEAELSLLLSLQHIADVINECIGVYGVCNYLFRYRACFNPNSESSIHMHIYFLIKQAIAGTYITATGMASGGLRDINFQNNIKV